MSRAIWKFQLRPNWDAAVTKAVLRVPAVFRALHVGVQPQKGLALWAMVCPDEAVRDVEITICGTGEPTPELDGYIGTVQDGSLVWHVFQTWPPVSRR